MPSIGRVVGFPYLLDKLSLTFITSMPRAQSGGRATNCWTLGRAGCVASYTQRLETAETRRRADETPHAGST